MVAAEARKAVAQARRRPNVLYHRMTHHEGRIALGAVGQPFGVTCPFTSSNRGAVVPTDEMEAFLR